MQYKGYLFGHYDSRGGATFIEGENELDARIRYIECGDGIEQALKDAEQNTSDTPPEWWSSDLPWNPHSSWAELHAIRDDREAVIRWLTEEDFISAVTLESYREIAPGEDIEWLEHSGTPEGRAFDEGLEWAPEDIASTTGNPYQEVLWWHEPTKTLKLTAPDEHPDGERHDRYSYPQKPIDKSWRRAEFGEDACGVIFVSRHQAI